MRTFALVAVTIVLVATSGCLRAGPPKTPNQREAERDTSRTTAPPPVPAPGREPPPFREH